MRPDSLGSLRPTNGALCLQFTGQDVHAHVLETSTDLVHWSPLGTNSPERGLLQFQVAPGPAPRFYRSLLAP